MEDPVAADTLAAKVCLVGEAAVGKTSLVRRFVFGKYSERYAPTVGATVVKKELALRAGGRDVSVVLTIWDIMGETAFRNLLATGYFQGGQGVLAVADLTRPPTVAALPAWIESARRVSGPVPVVLLGNKDDLPADREAEAVLGAFADALRCPRWRTSAKTGHNVEAAFLALAEEIAAAGLAQMGRGPEAGPPPRSGEGSTHGADTAGLRLSPSVARTVTGRGPQGPRTRREFREGAYPWWRRSDGSSRSCASSATAGSANRAWEYYEEVIGRAK